VSAGTQAKAIAHGEHVVRFYEHDVELVATVCPYIAAGLRGGEPVLLIATYAHRIAFETELADRGVDLARARDDGLLVSLDAAATLAAFSDGERIDRDAFMTVVGGLMREVCASGRTVRAYGEMVALLWDRGDVLAAIELERLWNELGRELPFNLLCAYPSASVAGSEHAEALHRVCAEHSASRVAPHAEGARHASEDLEARTVVSASFPADVDSPRHARRMAAATLRRWGHGETLIADVSLVVSELASNAVRHAGSSFSVALQTRGPLLRVTVEDRALLHDTASDARMMPRPPHGLCVVDSLATSWGVEPTRTGKLVWAQLTYAAPLEPWT
jgi:hypothetical protein